LGGSTNEIGVGQTNEVPASASNGPPAKAPEDPGKDILMKALAKVAGWVPAQLGKVSSWVESSIGFVLLPICLFYFLLEKKGINRSWADYLPIHESKAKEEIVFILQSINECMIVFFRGQVLVALCVGTLLTIAYLILGLNYAVLLGVVAGVLGIVPYLGTIVSLVLALTVAGVQFGDWTHPLCVIGIAAVVKMMEDLVISPKIIGNRSGLHPLTIILAVMIGANLLGGFLGALLAIPLTATLRTLMFRYVWNPQPVKAKIVESRQVPETVS
jgi:predicted PurR-regulated permease PerM